MAFDSADALAKTYARNKKLLSLRSITNGLQQTGLPLVLGGDQPCAAHVRFRGKSGHDVLHRKMSANDPRSMLRRPVGPKRTSPSRPVKSRRIRLELYISPSEYWAHHG